MYLNELIYKIFSNTGNIEWNRVANAEAENRDLSLFAPTYLEKLLEEVDSHMKYKMFHKNEFTNTDTMLERTRRLMSRWRLDGKVDKGEAEKIAKTPGAPMENAAAWAALWNVKNSSSSDHMVVSKTIEVTRKVSEYDITWVDISYIFIKAIHECHLELTPEKKEKLDRLYEKYKFAVEEYKFAEYSLSLRKVSMEYAKKNYHEFSELLGIDPENLSPMEME